MRRTLRGRPRGRINVPMGQNERLRAALAKSQMTVSGLAASVGVDPKTCERWITMGRTPHPGNAAQTARLLGEEVSYLWPDLERGRDHPRMQADLIAIYAARAGAPLETWQAMFEQAERRIGILVYAAVFLHELWPDFNQLLHDKAGQGCRVTVLLGDPASEAVALRGREEKYGHGIETRCRQALMHYAPLTRTDGIEIRLHATTLYNSIYIGDEYMIVNAHRYGINAYATPVLHLHRETQGGLFDGYLESFEQVRQLSRPATEE